MPDGKWLMESGLDSRRAHDDRPARECRMIVHSCLLASGLALAGIAINLNLPWLMAENQRIEPWKVPLVWSSEAVALVVFVGFCLARIVPTSLRRPRALPAPVIIVYDAAWPRRSWLAGLPYSDDNRIYLYSLLTLVFSSSLAALLATLRKHIEGLPPPEVAPFLGAVLVLCLGGVVQGGW
jgi:hypothetical protein